MVSKVVSCVPFISTAASCDCSVVKRTENTQQPLPTRSGPNKRISSIDDQEIGCRLTQIYDGNRDDTSRMKRSSPCIGCARRETHSQCPCSLVAYYKKEAPVYKKGRHTNRPLLLDGMFDDVVEPFARELSSPHHKNEVFTRLNGQRRV